MGLLRYSWIIPIFNEYRSLPRLFEEITKTGLKNYEIIAINDASTDSSAKFLKKLQKAYPRLKVINFKTHQGKWAALKTGFKASRGQIIITSDSDLQDDPGEVGKLLDKLNQGYDLVSGWRKVRHDPFYKVLISMLGNKLASTLTRQSYKDLNSPFKAYRKEVLDNLPNQGSLLRFSMLFADKLGYSVIEVPIVHRPRLFGKSKFGIVKYIRILYDLLLVLLLFSGSGRLRKQ